MKPERIINEIESEVRSYSRSFPKTFTSAKMCEVFDKDKNRYLDFFSGAGSLNYGHNNPYIKNDLIKYISRDGLTQGLDMITIPKINFLTSFKKNILDKRNLDYKVMFCGSTGTNSVEAALKLARKIKSRNTIFAFSGSFHGMTLGSLATTSSLDKRKAAGVSLNDVVFMPFPDNNKNNFNTIQFIKNILEDDHSGIELPAAIIIETIQAEGGVNVVSSDWLKELRQLCDNYDILLICDDIQVGCGRTGTFFSFENSGITPDMIVLSKSISGYGLPMSLLLFKPEFDIWEPGEHNGTFRGNQHAFVCATSAIQFMENNNLLKSVCNKELLVKSFIKNHVQKKYNDIEFRGKGLIFGIDFSRLQNPDICNLISKKCFEKGLIIEKSGRRESVLKILPPLVINESELIEGLTIIKECIDSELKKI